MYESFSLSHILCVMGCANSWNKVRRYIERKAEEEGIEL